MPSRVGLRCNAEQESETVNKRRERKGVMGLEILSWDLVENLEWVVMGVYESAVKYFERGE